MELQDKIGRQKTVGKICYLVDNLKEGNHFCLALDGEWGSGKTFVMQMIEEKLKTHAEYTVIKYDAWENNFYSDHLISILSCVIDGIQNKLSEMQGDLTVGKEIAKQIKDVALRDSGKIGVFARAIKDIADLVKLFNKPFTKDTDSKNISGFKSYQSLLKEVKDKLNSITDYEEYRDKQNKLIILVDEIDRCLPDEQLKILERLHHLFDVKNCAVICAINKNSVIENFYKQFGGDGKEYLQKFFDYNFKIKQDPTILLHNSFKDFFNELNQNFNENELIQICDQDYIIGYITEIIKNKNNLNTELIYNNNREITRYFENVVQIYKNYGVQYNQKYFVFFIGVMLMYKNIDPNLFKKFYQGSADLGEIENPLYTVYDGKKLTSNITAYIHTIGGEIPVKLFSIKFVNEITYILNLTKIRNNATNIKDLNQIYGKYNSVSQIDPKEYSLMWNILKEIDCYA